MSILQSMKDLENKIFHQPNSTEIDYLACRISDTYSNIEKGFSRWINFLKETQKDNFGIITIEEQLKSKGSTKENPIYVNTHIHCIIWIYKSIYKNSQTAIKKQFEKYIQKPYNIKGNKSFSLSNSSI